MRDIKLSPAPPYARIEVEGCLDVVSGHDVRRTLDVALGLGCRHISLDLSRVLGVDDEALALLLRCPERVRSSGGTLSISALSGPLRRIPALDDLIVPA